MGGVSSKRGGKQLFDEINITPLTDIFLVLLIIMMVVAPMMEQSRADIQPPKLSSGTSLEKNRLTVEVTSDGSYYVKGKSVAPDELTASLVEHGVDIDEKNVVIRADKAVKSKVIMKVLEAARDAKYEKVTVAGEALSSDRQQELQQASAGGM